MWLEVLLVCSRLVKVTLSVKGGLGRVAADEFSKMAIGSIDMTWK